MKKILVLFTVILYCQNSFSQNSDSTNDIQKATYKAEDVQVRAEFSNEEKQFDEFVKDNFKKLFYKELKGEVLVSFIIEIDGTLTNVKIIKEESNGTKKEIKQALVPSPKWLPAEHEGYRVRSIVMLNLKL